MACRDAYKRTKKNEAAQRKAAAIKIPDVVEEVRRLLFGADAAVPSTDLLQNNLTHFEWVVRNKIYPSFMGRNLTGENALTAEEIKFLHEKGCKIAAIYTDDAPKQTEEQGEAVARSAARVAEALALPAGTAIFLEIGETEQADRDFMRGFARVLLNEGYTPAFRANTDAAFAFDREFSRGMQTDREVFSKCLIWALAPTLAEYDNMTTTHLIHPDNWGPFAPSAISRKEIAVWQYGKDCHPIEDDAGKLTTFNLDLVRNEQVILDKMI